MSNGKEVICSHTVIALDWKDRIRVLFGRKLHCDVRVYTGLPEGSIPIEQSSTSYAYVESIFPHKPVGGYAISPTPTERIIGDVPIDKTIPKFEDER